MDQKSEGKSALIIVDVQNDFCEGGSLGVPNANEIIPLINKLRENPKFDCVFLSRDWHPLNPCSFSVNNPGANLYEAIILPDTGIE